jgi:murein DD-endopeptidase MepM/ murein hydrolase activator NlpD
MKGLGYMKHKIIISFAFVILVSLIGISKSFAADPELTDLTTRRMELYKSMEAALQVPWYYLAAADQYERNVREVRTDLEEAKGAISIQYPPTKWTGALNPDPEDINPISINFFHGTGLDGNGDHKADRTNDEDLLYTFAHHLLTYGTDEDNIRIAFWDFYKRDQAVGIIMNHAKVFEKYGRIDLQKKAFPVPIRTHYTYRSTWGVARGWGGRRSHEGTDIFADYGLPVRSTCYGVVEMKGWNKFGGWRVGIRDINNTYHYFAHLSGFSDGLKAGQVVEPGQVIGGVGSSGYGPPGTSGKFPPHLHYGMYKDNGKLEWSFDPYPHLKLWERQEYKKK